MNTDQTLNLPAIVRFLTSKEANLLFLALSFLMTVIIVVFVQPMSMLEFTTQTTRLSPLAQLSLMSVCGFAVVALSRALLVWVSSRKELALYALSVWMFVELILCVAVATLMAWSLSGGGPVKLAPLAGDILLGIVSVFLIPNVIGYLSFRLRELRSELVATRRRFTSESQAAPTEQSINFYDKGGRLAFSTRFANVLYIEAADNYANIHYINGDKEDMFILHNSLKDLEKEYSDMGLLRCHRGYMVNVANVKLMRKERSGLVLELATTAKTIPVSKSYTSDVTAFFSSDNVSPVNL